jgi:hypothetical protein
MLDRVALAERVALAAARLGFAPPPLPVPFFDAYIGAIGARAVMLGASLGLFAALAEAPDDAAGVARRTGLTEAGADVLLTALVSLGYVRLRGGRYRLSRTARRWLDPRSPRAMDAFVGGLAGRNWEALRELERVARGGEPLALHERPPTTRCGRSTSARWRRARG